MEHVFVSVGVSVAALFPIVDPVGNIASFLALTQTRDPSWRRRQAAKAAVTAAVMLATFLVVGHSVLNFFGVSLAAVEVVGGLIIGYTGWQMAMHPHRLDASEDPREVGEVFFHPLAFPLLAGPGALAVVLGLSNRHDSWLDFPGFVIGIGVVCVLAFGAMALATPIANRLGRHGIEVITRIMGLIVLAIAAELVFHGVADHFLLETAE
jgi:multiple antibiotic resistance protein